MSEIPSEIFREILLRVPAEPLLRFRAVCKEWRFIIDDKCFVETHSSYERIPFNFLIRNSIGTRLYSVSLDSLDVAEGSRLIPATTVKTFVRRGVPRVPKFPVPSCNGLILIVKTFDLEKNWVIWNWLTREFHELPKAGTESEWYICCGFGYDFSTNDYKVVRVGSFGVQKSRTLVYSLKSDSWKMIKDFPSDISFLNYGIYLNGVLYWRTREMITALDLGSEDFSQLPRPPKEIGQSSTESFDAMGGCLVFSFCNVERLDIWVMNDCRVEKLWTKLYSLQRWDIHYGIHMSTVNPVAYLKSHGKVLLVLETGKKFWKKFFWLDIKKKSIKMVEIRGLQGNFLDFTCRACPGSLFRLDQSCDARSRAPRKRKRRVESKEAERLEISVNISDLDVD